MKRQLLLGAGYAPYEKRMGLEGETEWGDLVTLDSNKKTEPAIVHDLGHMLRIYNCADDEFDEVHAYHVLEHTGKQGDIEFFFWQWREFWRITKPGGYFFGIVPSYKSVWAWGDPGHTRVINEGTIIFLDKMQYENQVGKTPMSDYKQLLQRCYWQPLSLQDSGEEFRFVLRKVVDG